MKEHHEILAAENGAKNGAAGFAATAPTFVLDTSNPATTANSAMSPLAFLRALRRQLLLALGAGLALALVVGPVAYFVVPPAKYRAEALLHVMAQSPVVLTRTVDSQGGGGDEYRRYQQTQTAYLESRSLLISALGLKVVDVLKDEENVNRWSDKDMLVGQLPILRQELDPIGWLQERLEVKFRSGSELLSIALAGDDPQAIAVIVNAVVESYTDEVVNRDFTRRQDRFGQLEILKSESASRLREQRDSMKRLVETVGSDDRQTVALKQQFALDHLQAVERELLDVQSHKRRLEAELKSMGMGAEAEPGAARAVLATAEVERLMAADPVVQQYNEQLAAAEVEFRTAWDHLRRLSRQAATDPSIRGIRERVDQLRKGLAQRESELRPKIIGMLQSNLNTGSGPAPLDPATEILHNLEIYKEWEVQLQTVVDQLRQGNHQLTVDSVELQDLQDVVLQLELSYNKISAEYEALLAELKAPPRVVVWESATPPLTKDDKKRYMMIALATLGSLGAGVAGVTLLELNKRRVGSADEVVLGLGLELLGCLPLLPARTRRKGLGQNLKDRYWQNLLFESVDATRAMLIHEARNHSYQVVMVTSALSGEGKTSLSSHLAISLARSGLEILLVDADLRRPSIHRLFDLPIGPGLSELLKCEALVNEVISTSPFEGLDILTAGQFDARASRALATGRLDELFRDFKRVYDFVIVDSSPVLPVADALLIAPKADAVLFSILQGVSRTPKVVAAHQKLRGLGTTVLGGVVATSGGHDYGGDYYDTSGRAYVETSVAQQPVPGVDLSGDEQS